MLSWLFDYLGMLWLCGVEAHGCALGEREGCSENERGFSKRPFLKAKKQNKKKKPSSESDTNLSSSLKILKYVGENTV